LVLYIHTKTEQNTEISGLSKLIHDNRVILLKDHNDYTDYDIIKTILDQEEHIQNSSFYIVDLGEIIRRYHQWVRLLPNVIPYYAVKCNPNPVICKLMAILGAGFDVASKEEINIVKDDAEYGKIIYAHPYKECTSLQYARTVDVDLSVFDSIYELDKIKLLHPNCQLLLRIKVDDKNSACRLNSKFGADMDDIDDILRYAKTSFLNVVGVSFHVGSDCGDASQYYAAIKQAKEVFDIGKKYEYNMNILDLGGGFPGKRSEGCTALFEQMCTHINKGLEEFFSDIPTLKVMAEPGRYFVQASHILVVNVVGKNLHVNRETKEKQFIYYINDGVYGGFNCIVFDHQKPEILPYNERNEKERYKSIIFGRTCDSMDKISDDITLPQLEINDYLFVPDFGAYTVAAASTFNGFPKIRSYYVMTL
jgi:diaminopimelate decarboxylase